MQHYVAGFLFSPDMKSVVLIKKNKPEWMKGFLNAIGGKIEGFELAVEAQRREFIEETGVDIPKKDWELFCVLSGRQPNDEQFRVYFSRAISEKYETVLSMKEEEVAVYNVADVCQLNSINNLKWLLPLATDNDIKFPVVVTEKI